MFLSFFRHQRRPHGRQISRSRCPRHRLNSKFGVPRWLICFFLAISDGLRAQGLAARVVRSPAFLLYVFALYAGQVRERPLGPRTSRRCRARRGFQGCSLLSTLGRGAGVEPPKQIDVNSSVLFCRSLSTFNFQLVTFLILRD